jgi:hypothetical protein
MLWSRLHHGLPPGLRYLPKDDWPPRPVPLLAQPFPAGMTGWVVVFGAVIAELTGGVAATQMPARIAVPVLIFPVAVAFGFAAVQWWQVRSWGGEPVSRWHLAGTAAAALTWLLWPTIPRTLAYIGVLPSPSSNQALCGVLPSTSAVGYVRCMTRALDYHDLAWWSAGALILVAALLARRSRIAAWAAIPAAFAGCELATYFLSR